LLHEEQPLIERAAHVDTFASNLVKLAMQRFDPGAHAAGMIALADVQPVQALLQFCRPSIQRGSRCRGLQLNFVEPPAEAIESYMQASSRLLETFLERLKALFEMPLLQFERRRIR
jgi:hypothetical protein